MSNTRLKVTKSFVLNEYCLFEMEMDSHLYLGFTYMNIQFKRRKQIIFGKSISILDV